ncbi:putative 3-oxo-5-alpha-steroid 4-dehydrogenase (NADP(+)) [Medicago truncatula]|uniref:3-oxo-5-alpha-steroid 4-dehydrogenase family protein n=1 Tax=Medicago truncatula TaxID=3880 RepID=A0A072UJC1_MEDTR|nr:steroid 5-alpha-reductase DET2 [Medicago truncatula]KEH25895.1 3-oxo-5-alpha-steroid 4-dehydrogenase family protein [Medicago truncatula]RHN51068.1 putative 3-oxo-5-alpha-steroid 4-dehydrogenase (NADP(+)) [Medicago truncatula]
MAMSMFFNFMFPPPSSIFVTAMSIISFVALANYGISEIRGKHLNYSKFWNANNNKTNSVKQIKLSSKVGMLLLYTPAFLAGAVSFWIFPNEGLRSTILQGALTLHYFKRVFESLFVHKYSGSMILDSAIPITLSYLMSTITMIYGQHLTKDLPEPQINLIYPGIVLFLVGIIGNFYHHFLLSKLRGKGEKEYKIPKGGLFGIVICPHYMFEIIDFYGVFFISQTLYSLIFAIGTTFYLLGRSHATRNWYLSKFEDFPKNVKAVIPFVF